MLKVQISNLPVRGYHVYKRKLQEKVKSGDKLKLSIETERYHETSTFPVAATRYKGELAEKIGHLPKDFSWCFKVILRTDGGKIHAIVTSEIPVSGHGEEIICDFSICGKDIQEVRYALDNLYKIIQEPCWVRYKPRMVQLIKEGKKMVLKDWSLKKDSEDQQEQDNVPEELDNNPFTRSLYEKAIAEGEEEDRSIRIMVVGCYEQGKTSLVRKLLGEEVENVASTNGIDVINFEIKGEDNTWERRINDIDTDTVAARRLTKVCYPKNGQDNKRERQELSSSFMYTRTRSHDKAKKRRTDASCSNDVLDDSLESSGEDESKQQPSSCSSDRSIYEKYSLEINNSSLIDAAKESLSGYIWDFGGQYIFYSTHQLFHSRQAIYLLIFDLSFGLEKVVKDEDFPNKKNEKTLKDFIRFWVHSIHSFVGTESGEEPYIILVGTHKDKISADKDLDEYFEDVRKIFDGTKQKYHIHHKHFAVSNVKHDAKEIRRFRKEITRLGELLAKKQAHLPARWILLEKELKENQHEKITTFDNILAINKKMPYPLEGQCQVKLFLQFHHARGSLFYFHDTELSKYVVLDTQYLIDAFRCVVTSGKFCRSHPKLRDAWKRLCEDAVLESDLVQELWGTKPDRNFLQHKNILLGFLQRHRILSPEADACYIVPSLLKTRFSARRVSKFISGKVTTQVALVYEFENDCIVETIFHRVIAAALGKWPAIVFSEQCLLFENLSVFEIQLDHAGMIFFNDNKLELLVVNQCPPEQVSSKLCDLFRRTFESIVCIEFQKLRVGEDSLGGRKLLPDSVRCYNETHGLYGSKHVHLITKIEKSGRPSICCPDNESHSIKVKEIYKEWYNNGIDLQSVPKRELTLRECGILSTSIGSGWPLWAIELGFSYSRIEQIESDFSSQSRRILEMLTKWQQAEDDKATLDVLVAAILDIPCKDLARDEETLKNIIDGLY